MLHNNPAVSVPTLFHSPSCLYSTTYHNLFITTPHVSGLAGVVDCSQEQSLCATFNITKYPTLIIMQMNTGSINYDEQLYI